jgi:hypothetical protein
VASNEEDFMARLVQSFRLVDDHSVLAARLR